MMNFEFINVLPKTIQTVNHIVNNYKKYGTLPSFMMKTYNLPLTETQKDLGLNDIQQTAWAIQAVKETVYGVR